MDDHPPRRARLLEFATAAALVGATSLFLLDSLSDLQAEAERVAVDTTVRNMNSGLFLRQAELMVSGREGELPALVLGNPVEWLETPPPGYEGSVACGPAGPASPGGWCWDAAARRLHYLPRRAGRLKAEGSPPIMTWRVQAPADPAAIRPGALRVIVDRTPAETGRRG